MHKNIVNAIRAVLIQHRVKFDIFIRVQTTGGFWGMIVVMPEEKKIFLPHVESVAMSIGRMYGEGLHISKLNDRTLKID